MYDDYVEVKPGSVKLLERSLNSRRAQSNVSNNASGAPGKIFSGIATTLRSLFASRPGQQAPSLPQYAPPSTAGGTGPTSANVSVAREAKYLLLASLGSGTLRSC